MPLSVNHHCKEVSTTIKWKIEEFSTAASRENSEFILVSDEFFLYKRRLSFCLKFEPTNTEAGGDKTYSSLFLLPQNWDNDNELQFNWKFWIENEDGFKIGKQREQFEELAELDCEYGFERFVNHSELYPPSDFVKNDYIYICCEITQKLDYVGFKQILLNDEKILKHVYRSNKIDDDDKVIIQSKKRKLSINKSLLTFRSEVFEQMFENKNFVETKDGVIKIYEFSEESVEAFHKFMHLGYVTEENVEYAHELLKMSDKYGVDQLKEECTQILGKTLNKDNIFSLLITSFMHDCPKLKEMVLAYVTKSDSDSNFKMMTKSKEWKDFVNENERVSDEIIDAVFEKLNCYNEVPSNASLPSN